MNNVTVWFCKTALCLCLALGPFQAAMAQDAEDEDVFTLEEVTVTAEKRTDNVQKIAMSVTAIGGDAIDKKSIADIKGALETLAGVKVMGGPFGGKVFIRGIGSNLDYNMGDPSVAISKDNIYMQSAESTLSTLYDVERVEVLRGPQGTMYGRNAAGGQVNVITKNPTLEEVSGSGNLSIGTYNLTSYNAAINLPMTEQLAARVAMDQQKHDGYISDGSGSADKFATRAKIVYEPASNLSVLFTGEYSHDKSSNMNTVPTPGSAGNLPSGMAWVVPDADGDGEADDVLDADGNEVAGGNGVPDIVDTGWEIPYGGDAWTNDIYHPAPKGNNKFYNASLEVNYDLPFATMTLLPTFSKSERSLWSEMIQGISTGGDLNEQAYETEQWTGEVRFSNAAESKITWTVGGYTFDMDNKDTLTEETDPLAQAQDLWENGSEGGGPGQDAMDPEASNYPVTANYRRPSTAFSYFGQATYPVTDRFRVVGGFRGSKEDRDLAYRIVIYDVTEDAYPEYYAQSTLTSDGRHQYDSGVVETSLPSNIVDWKGGLELDLAEDKMLYAFVTTGYKAGGLNIQGVTPPSEYDPEELMAYTIGSKNRFFNNTLQLNFEAYYYDYDGYQVQYMTQVYDSLKGTEVGVNMISNAESGTNMGLEMELDWMVTSKDRVDLTFAYMKTEFGELTLPPQPDFGVYDDYELTGSDLPKAPEWSGTFQYEHTFDLSNGSTITPRLYTKISAGFWNTNEKYIPGAWTDSYHMSDIYLTWLSADAKYSVSMWCKNVENAEVTDYVFPVYRRIIMEPRTSGITFSAKF